MLLGIHHRSGRLSGIQLCVQLNKVMPAPWLRRDVTLRTNFTTLNFSNKH